MKFAERYKKLNVNQKTAVDSIDGPVMVIAGPGTGKTELLSMRAANILQKTDVLPENILCLTFTEAGSSAMQKRLTDIIGRDAYNVSIHTFHAFGSEIMNRYRQYFYNGASFRLANDLTRYHIITEILDSLQYDNPLRSQMNGRYTAINDIMSAISDLKRSGLTDAEFGQLLDAAQTTVDIAGKVLSPVFSQKISAATIEALESALVEIQKIKEETPVVGIVPLKSVLENSIRHALDDAKVHPKKTPPITAWKKEWMTADADKSQVLKAQKSLPKLKALNLIYSLYLQLMSRRELIDYDDMIMQVVHAIEVYDDLRFDLQEKYHYIMVDEFQDTNMAQMRILHNLLDNQVNEGKPNILVVGDDDQAIYGFQGAEVSNILNFKDTYPDSALISLTENYRSVSQVLDSARDVITQGRDRLETRIPDLTKKLHSNSKAAAEVEIHNFQTPHSERKWITTEVKNLIDAGTEPNEIAIIARKHSDLVNLLSYLANDNVPISYDRRDNVLDDEAVMQLELVANIIHCIGTGQHDEANTLIPELLSHPAWGIHPETVWQISLASHKNKCFWLETMKENEATEKMYSWLVASAISAQHLPLERMIDILLGVTSQSDEYVSPLKEFFFSKEKMKDDASGFARHLENLAAIRTRLREHSVDMSSPRLVDFLKFMDDNRQAGTTITSLRHIGENEKSVRLMTAHGSKGLEFDHVFIVNATDSMWGEKARGKVPAITFLPHLRLRQQNNDYDERLRLFYVAMTRARRGLHISYANENDAAKELFQAAFLLDSNLPHSEIESKEESPVESAEQLWYAPIINIPSATMQDLLAPILERYKISATHVNNFVDVTNGGPQRFLLNTLLRFPSAPSAAANYGIAIHSTLQRAHDHIRSTGTHLPEEDVLHEFEKQLGRMVFTEDERRMYLQKGCDSLRAFLKTHYDSFNENQMAEFDFGNQEVRIGESKLTGKLDVVEADKTAMEARVIDYKTGSPLESWDKGSPYQKIKAHKYRQQLLFYKLLVENSRDLRKFTMNEAVLQFVETNPSGTIVDLTLNDIGPEELEKFKRLVQAIWQRIINLDFPDTSEYEDSIEGILQFEEDLLTNTKF